MDALKFHYFLAFAVLGTIVPFQPILLSAAGVSDGYLGLVLGAPGLVTMAMPPLMGYLGDRHIVSRNLISALFFVITILFLSLYVVEALPILIALNLAIACLTTPALALLDVVALHTLRDREAGSERNFPRVRRWGSIGFIAPAVALFLVHDLAALSPTLVYIIGAVFALLSAVSARLLPAIAPAAHAGGELPTITALRTLFRPPLRSLTVALAFVFLGVAVLYLLLPRYLQTLGVSPGKVGLIVSLGVALEIMLLSYAHRCIDRFGLRVVVIVGVGLTAVRLGALALAPSLSIAVLTQVLHAPLVLVIAVALPIILTRHAGPEIRNSIVGTATGINTGLLRLIGASLAGFVVAITPGTELDRICVALGMASGFFVIATFLLARRGSSDEGPIS